MGIQNALLELAEEHAGFGCWELDLDSGRLTVSPPMRRIFGVDSGKDDFDIEAAAARVRPEDREQFRALLSPPPTSQACELGVDPEGNGDYRWMRAEPRTIAAAGGEATHVVGILRDVHESHQQTSLLREHSDKLEECVQERTKELQARADQLRHLAIQLTLAEQRERRSLSELLHDDLQQMLVSAHFNLTLATRYMNEPSKLAKLLAEVQDIISEATEKSRSLSYELTPPTLHAHGLLSAVQWLAKETKKRHGLQVTVTLDTEAEPPAESARILLYKCLSELLFNVVKHANTAHAEVRVRMERQTFLLTVSDEGTGFDVETLQADRDDAGGFGLFSIRERVELLGGEVEVESAPEAGTAITIRLPQTTPQAAPSARALVDAATSTDTVELKRPTLAKGRRIEPIAVMLVDDHAVVRQGVAALLRGYPDLKVAGEASSGQEAIALAAELHPGLILMDISMPGIDGIETTRLIKEEQPEIIIIGLSMHEEPQLYTAMLQAGASAVLSKAEASEQLVHTIEQQF